MLNVSGSMSTKTGVPPVLWIVPPVAKKLKAVVITSSPGASASAFSGNSSASVPLAHPMPCRARDRRAISTSSCATAGPLMNCGDSMTARTDEGVLAQGDPAHDGGVGADGAAALDAGGPEFALARDEAAGVGDVGEDARRPAEDVVLQLDTLVDRDVVLDLAVVPDPRPGHDDDVLAQGAALTDDGPRHDVAEVPDLGALPDDRPRLDVARFVDEVVGHLADHLDFQLELHAGLLLHRLAHVLDEPQHVARCRRPGIDEVVRVHGRYLGAADRVSLESALVHEHPGRLRAAGVLEDRPGARLVERRPGLAPPQQLPLQLLQLGGGLLEEEQLRLQHDDVAEVRGAILERDLLAGQLPDLALPVHHAHFRDDLGEPRPVGRGIHVNATAHRAGDPDEPLDPGEPSLRRAARPDRGGHPGADARARALQLERVQPLAEPNHETGEAALFDEQVRPKADREPRQTALVGELDPLRHILHVGGHEEVARRSTEPVRGVARQRFVLQQPPAELDLGRGRRRGRRCGLGRGLRAGLGCRPLGYARTPRGPGLGAALAASDTGFPTLVFACHSWRLLTLPIRLRNAMIASQAALAADIVVVYGTRCTSAVRRIA